MWNYEKRLQFPVKIKEPNAKLAQVMLGRALETAVARLFGKGPKYGDGNIA